MAVVMKEELDRMRELLEPFSSAAVSIRQRIADGYLEPPDLVYLTHIDSLIASIGAGEWIEPEYEKIRERMEADRITVETYRLAMEYWRLGWSRSRAVSSLLLAPPIVDEVFECLGEPDDEKRRAVEMVVRRLDPVSRDLAIPNEIHDRLGTWEPASPSSLEEKVFHDVTRLDFGTWKMVPNIQLITRNIGAKERLQELHCWVGNPEEFAGLQLRVNALRDWLEGRSTKPDTCEMVEALGSKDAYKEKVWLASALLLLLERNIENQYLQSKTDDN